MSTTALKKWTPEEKKIVFDLASNLDLTPTKVILAATADLPNRTRGAVEYQYYNETQYLVEGRKNMNANRNVWTPTNVEMLKRLISDPQYNGKSQNELAVIATPLFKEAGITTTAIAKKISKIKLAKKSNKKNGKAVAAKSDAVRSIVKWKGREDAIIKKAHKQHPNLSQTQLTKLVTTELPGRSPSAIQSRVSMLLRSKPNVSVEKPTATKQTVPAAKHASNSMVLTLPFEVKNIVFRGGNAIEINGSESDNGLISVSINEEHNRITIKTGGKDCQYISLSAPGEAVVKF